MKRARGRHVAHPASNDKWRPWAPLMKPEQAVRVSGRVIRAVAHFANGQSVEGKGPWPVRVRIGCGMKLTAFVRRTLSNKLIVEVYTAVNSIRVISNPSISELAGVWARDHFLVCRSGEYQNCSSE